MALKRKILVLYISVGLLILGLAGGCEPRYRDSSPRRK